MSTEEQRTAKKIRERLELRQVGDARHYGGRRTGLPQDQQEVARRTALEQRLLELAREAIQKYR